MFECFLYILCKWCLASDDVDCFVFVDADNDVDVIFIDFDVARDRPTCKSPVCGLCLPFEWFMLDVFCCWFVLPCWDEGWLTVVPFSFPTPAILLELFERLLICRESVPKDARNDYYNKGVPLS